MSRYVGNQEFDERFFNNYIKTIFGEAFSHSSLSTEKLFLECNKYALQLRAFTSRANRQYYDMILNYGRNDDIKILYERKEDFKNYLKYMKGISTEKFYDEDNEPLPCLADFDKYFPYVYRPFRSKSDLDKAIDNNEELYMPYEKETMVSQIEELYQIIYNKLQADKVAHNHKRDNHKAFLYALEQEKLAIPEIIKINEIVNDSDDIHVGFKSVENTILKQNELGFETCPKSLVPVRMQELIYMYNNDWNEEIPKFNYLEELKKFNDMINKNAYSANEIAKESEILEKKREEHDNAILLREAKFHIEFERIHPFEDGNGRTGRIILNKNLIDNGFAPIIIPKEIREQYVSCINDPVNGPTRFAEIIKILSSSQKSMMVSSYRDLQGFEPYELSQSELGNKDNKNLETGESSVIEDDTRIYPGPNVRKKEDTIY